MQEVNISPRAPVLPGRPHHPVLVREHDVEVARLQSRVRVQAQLGDPVLGAVLVHWGGRAHVVKGIEGKVSEMQMLYLCRKEGKKINRFDEFSRVPAKVDFWLILILSTPNMHLSYGITSI